MMLRHHRRRHGEQHAVGVNQADLLALAHKRDRLALNDRDANLVRQQAHDGGVLDPGNLLQLPAALGEGNKEDVAADVFAEDGQHSARLTSARPVAWMLLVPLMRKRASCSRNACASVGGDSKSRQNRDEAVSEKARPNVAGGTPPGPSGFVSQTCAPFAAGAWTVIVLVVHQTACRADRDRNQAHSAARAGSGAPRALPPPIQGTGLLLSR